jgi:hypothetical protein
METTKVRALRSLDRVTVRDRVRECILVNPGISRAEIAAKLRVRLSSVCGRVNELMKLGEIKVCGEIVDNFTRKSVEVFKVA